MRLDKYLSESSPYTRGEIKKLIRRGVVTVNGEIAKRPETAVSETDEISVEGRITEYDKYIYLLLNKPRGYVSAAEDRLHRTVTELVPEEYARYRAVPAGRLDIDTEGLLILTNDGAVAHEIISPKKNIYKRYFARLDKPAEEADKAVFAAGMEFREFTAKPARLEICRDPREVFIEIAEGKYHQIKRMTERVGKTVTYLRRDAIGGLTLPEGSAPGDLFKITKEELLARLRRQ